MWKTMKCVLWLLVFVDHLQSCRSEVFNCTVTQTSNGTFYIVPEYTGSLCDFSWTIDGIVIANKKDNGELVMSSSNRSLQTHKCHKEINFTYECSGPKHYARCITTCSENAGLQKDTGTPDIYWIIPVVVLITLAVICISCMAYRRRRRPVYNPATQQDRQSSEGIVLEECGGRIAQLEGHLCPMQDESSNPTG